MDRANPLRTASLRRVAQHQIIRLFVGMTALIAYTGVVVADSPTRTTGILPMQGEEFCGTEAGGLIEALIGIMIVMFFAALVVAIFAAASIEALPMTGWWNQMGYSMMGKIPVAAGFVFIALAMLTLVDGTFGITAPPCVPVVGG